MIKETRLADDSDLCRLADMLRDGALSTDSGVLEFNRLARHSRTCSSCREALLLHAHREVALAEIRELAEGLGVDSEVLGKRISEVVRAAIFEGRAAHVFKVEDINASKPSVKSDPSVPEMLAPPSRPSPDVPMSREVLCDESVIEALNSGVDDDKAEALNPSPDADNDDAASTVVVRR